MKKVAFIALLLGGCASSTMYNVKNTAFDQVADNSLGTYSDYDNPIEYNEALNLHQLTVYVGGTANCDGGVLIYAKPKMDQFMQDNGFSSYEVTKGDYAMLPLSKCDLQIKYYK